MALRGPTVACAGGSHDGDDCEFQFAMSGLAWLLVRAYLAAHAGDASWPVGAVRVLFGEARLAPVLSARFYGFVLCLMCPVAYVLVPFMRFLFDEFPEKLLGFVQIQPEAVCGGRRSRCSRRGCRRSCGLGGRRAAPRPRTARLGYCCCTLLRAAPPLPARVVVPPGLLLAGLPPA